jgi:cystathionine beta-lyase
MIKEVKREGINALKWNGDFIKRMGLIEDFNDQTIPMWVADMDLRIAEPIEKALVKAATQGSFGYTTTLGDTEYFEICQSYFKRRYDFDVDLKKIFMAPGTLHTINASIKVFTDEGDGIIIQRPVYTQFTNQIKSTKRVVKDNHLILKNGQYEIDFDNLEELAKDENTKMLIFCNPHNPVGKMYNEEDLIKVAKICEDNKIVIVSDEVHAGIVKPGAKHIPIAKVTNYKNIITCTDFGKTFNTASLHICNVICEDPSHIMQLKLNGAAPASSSFGINAVKAAYTECDEWIDQLNHLIVKNKQYIKEFVTKHLPTIKYTVSDATYFAWVDFSGYNLTEEQLNTIIRKECNIVLENGAMFAKDHALFQRIVLACPFETVVKAMDRIKEAFNKYEANY